MGELKVRWVENNVGRRLPFSNNRSPVIDIDVYFLDWYNCQYLIESSYTEINLNSSGLSVQCECLIT